jgi:glutathione S-transferase
MSDARSIQFMGAPGSPYTRKMIALLRYRRIPYQVKWQSRLARDSDTTLPQPKVSLLPTFYLPDENGDLQAVTDSSPILRRFETEYNGRHAIPNHPALSFINWLIEDYGDEWLTKSMFHYRWHYDADIQKAGSILPRWGNNTGSDEAIAPISEFIINMQTSRLSYVGSNETTKPIIEASFHRFLSILNDCLQENPFLFGKRPASADFALYGQLTCLALFDPTPQAIITNQFPRIYAWVELMEDLSGLDISDDDWIDIQQGLPHALHALLEEIGRIYLPYLHANAAAVRAGAEQMDAKIDGQTWMQNPFPYQAKCLQWIIETYQGLDPESKRETDRLLAGTGIIEHISD